MKRVFSLILVWAMLIGMVPVNAFAAGTESVHEHDYVTVEADPTCTEQGYTTYTCACGDSYMDDYVEATGHEFGDWMITAEPA